MDPEGSDRGADGILQGLGHLPNLVAQPFPDRLVDGPLALDDLDEGVLAGRKAEAMDTVLRLKVMGGVESPVQIDRMVANAMEAHPLPRGGRIGDHDHHVVVVMEGFDLALARPVVVLVPGIDPAMDVNRPQVAETLGEIFDVVPERGPDQDLLAFPRQRASPFQDVSHLRALAFREDAGKQIGLGELDFRGQQGWVRDEHQQPGDGAPEGPERLLAPDPQGGSGLAGDLELHELVELALQRRHGQRDHHSG